MSDVRAARAILMARHNQFGANIDCKLAYPKERKDRGSRKIFVGGLSPEVTQAEFDRFFSRFGTIEDSVVMRDKATKKPRGFGFVTYTYEASVELVIKNFENNTLRGRWVECKIATPKENDYTPPMSPVSTAESGSLINGELDSQNICMQVIHDVLDEDDDWLI